MILDCHCQGLGPLRSDHMRKMGIDAYVTPIKTDVLDVYGDTRSKAEEILAPHKTEKA